MIPRSGERNERRLAQLIFVIIRKILHDLNDKRETATEERLVISKEQAAKWVRKNM
jgi:hypothetical protein